MRRTTKLLLTLAFGLSFLTFDAQTALAETALGLTAAGKYVYAVAGLAIVADYLWRLFSGWREREKGGKGEREMSD